MAAAEVEQFYARDRTAWREWLMAHGTSARAVWLIYDKGAKRTMSYEDMVEEALCFGWVDSKSRGVDEHRTSLYMAPRNRKSAWSKPNKERIERLTKEGLMQPAGLAVVAAAQASGTWTALDAVEQLLEPDDLKRALDAEPTARTAWDSFPRSAKRALLEWIVTAKRAQTRAARIEQTVREAALGRRADQRPED